MFIPRLLPIPSLSAAIGCVRTATPLFGRSDQPSLVFQAELGGRKAVGAWRFVPDRAASGRRPQQSCSRISRRNRTHLPASGIRWRICCSLNAASATLSRSGVARMVKRPARATTPSPENVFVPANTNANRPPPARGTKRQVPMLASIPGCA